MTSDVFLTALRVTDNQEELNATRDMISREIAQLVRHQSTNQNLKTEPSPLNVTNQYKLDMIALLHTEHAVVANVSVMVILGFLSHVCLTRQVQESVSYLR